MKAENMSKVRLALALAALFLSTSCTMGDMVVVPIFANLFEVFPQTAIVNGIISWPSIVGLFFCLIGGYLTDKMDKKWLMVIGFALYTATSVFGCAIENVYYIAACRCLATGAGWGLTSSAAFAIIADLYEDENKRGTVNGWYNASMALMGAALSFIGGLLAVSAWQNAFKAYWLNLPILIMLIVFLPAMPPRKDVSAETKTSGKTSGKDLTGWYKPLIPIIIQVLVVASCYYVIAYMISVYVADAGIGNEAFSGTLASVGTIFSFLANLVFGLYYAKLKKATGLPSFLALGVCFLLMGFIPTKAISLVCCAVMGGFWGIFYSFFYTETTVVVPEEKQGTAIGIVNAVNGLCMVVCTYGVTALEGAMKTTSIVPLFPIFGALCLVIAVYSFILVARARKAV